MSVSSNFSWPRLIQQAQGLLSVSTNRISNAANLSALLYAEVPDVSWVGFYFLQAETLMLGPFQGKPACVAINMGEGVCGAVAVSGASIRVNNIEEFEGHIACDTEARSEVVVPLIIEETLIGVLDLDSSSLDRFSHEDQQGLQALAQVYLSSISG